MATWTIRVCSQTATGAIEGKPEPRPHSHREGPNSEVRGVSGEWVSNQQAAPKGFLAIEKFLSLIAATGAPVDAGPWGPKWSDELHSDGFEATLGTMQ